MYMSPTPNGVRDRAISLYSSKTVDNRERLSCDKLHTVYLVSLRGPSPPANYTKSMYSCECPERLSR
jgi:hypothetical protein